MSGQTTGGLPYPDPTDPVADGADAIRALAEAIDPRLPAGSANGVVSFSSTAGGATKSVAVTFPSGAFDGVPSVVISPISSAPGSRAVSVASTASTGFIAYFSNLGATAVALDAGWIAQKRTAALSALLAAGDAPDATVTCPTLGCENRGIPLSIATHYVDDDGNPGVVDEVECGVCGTVLTPVPIGDGS